MWCVTVKIIKQKGRELRLSEHNSGNVTNIIMIRKEKNHFTMTWVFQAISRIN